ncbi:MAG: J domain-containing protein [bacterium]|nr:J domain-containing protein [bacterium]
MSVYSNLYEILEVPVSAAEDEIKSAFRRLAKVFHPDKNKNTPGSDAQFIIIHNAYSVLTDPNKRKEYDTYLRTSSSMKSRKQKGPGKKAVLPGTVSGRDDYLDAVSCQFNFLLWDVEEILRQTGMIFWNREKLRHIDVNIWDKEYSGGSPGDYVLKILFFLDKWVLTPAGYKDHFLNTGIKSKADCKNYFYSIHTRTIDLLKNAVPGDLMKILPGSDIRLIDAIFEAQNHAIHYISFINQVLAGEIDFIPPFQHSNSCYE